MINFKKETWKGVFDLPYIIQSSILIAFIALQVATTLYKDSPSNPLVVMLVERTTFIGGAFLVIDFVVKAFLIRQLKAFSEPLPSISTKASRLFFCFLINLSLLSFIVMSISVTGDSAVDWIVSNPNESISWLVASLGVFFIFFILPVRFSMQELYEQELKFNKAEHLVILAPSRRRKFKLYDVNSTVNKETHD